MGSQIFGPHQPSSHRRFCRMLWVTSTARLIKGIVDPYSIAAPIPSTCEDFLLSAALLTPLPCLELTIAVHQPLAKPYSMVVTVAVCLHEAEEPSSTTTTTA